MNKNHIWRLWCKSIGPKEGTSDSEADKIAIIRTVIVVANVLSAIAVVAGVIRHW